MFERYCDIKYRDCFLEIDEHNRTEPTKNHFFTAKSSSMGIYEGRSLVGRYPEVKTVISEFFRLIDGLLGWRDEVISESDNFLYCNVLYKGYELNIYHKTKESYYCAWIDGFDFAAWGEWSIDRFVSVIDAFREKVDSGTGENLIHTFANYKGHNLEVRQEAEDSEWFVGTSKIGGKNWIEKGYKLTSLIKCFEYCVDLHLRDEELEKTTTNLLRRTKMTYELFKNESDLIGTLYDLENLDNLSFCSLQDLSYEYTKLVGKMLVYIKETTEEVNMNSEKDIERKLLRQTCGVFKYMTTSSARGYVSYTSSKNEFVQVGYLDLNNNIVFDEVKRPAVDELDATTITRYLPGFHVRGYRSCEEYIPSLSAPSHVTKEIREVVSTTIVQYNPSKYGTDSKEAYSVIGFLDENNVFIQYSQIIEEQSND